MKNKELLIHKFSFNGAYSCPEKIKVSKISDNYIIYFDESEDGNFCNLYSLENKKLYYRRVIKIYSNNSFVSNNNFAYCFVYLNNDKIEEGVYKNITEIKNIEDKRCFRILNRNIKDYNEK